MQDTLLPRAVHIFGDSGERPDWVDHLTAWKIEVSKKDSSVLVVPLDWSIAKLKRTINAERKKNPALVVVGAGEVRHLKGLSEVFQEGLIDVVTDRNANEAQLKQVLKRAQWLLDKRESAQQDLLKTKDQNRYLEQLGAGLEDTVRQRTKSANDSKVEVEKRVTQLRELLRFMQDLATATAPEDVLKFLRRELKVFHRIREPVLAFSLSSGERRLVYFRGGQVFERSARRGWPQSLRLRRNDAGDSQYLADEFGRPVNRVLAIPLIARKPQNNEQLQPTLYFEHQLKDHEIDQFVNFIGDRLQVVNVALDRLLLEFDLRSATYLWEHTFDGLEDPVAIVDLDFRLLRSNRAFMGAARHESCHQTFNDHEQVCAGCPLNETLRSALSTDGLVRRGTQMFAVHSYPILMDPQDRPTTVVNHYLNVTQDLALHERMVQTEKMAALGHLAGHIAHELNNPLTGIRGLAQVWLAAKGETSQLGQDLQEIEKAAERSQNIIANLLQFATANDTEQVAKADLKQIVQKTLPLLKTALSNHSVNVELGEGPAMTRVAPQLMQQVIFNLLKNACQAMPQKGQVDVKLVPISLPNGFFWQLSIRDSGVGIAAQHMENLFIPFYTTKAEGEGTGLGLSLSRTLVRRFSGEIAVSSKLGQGTEFRVLLPRETEDI